MSLLPNSGSGIELTNLNLELSDIDSVGVFGLLAGKGLTPYDGTVEFIEPEGLDQPFGPHYEKMIRPKISEFENRRISALISFRKNLFVLIPVVIFSVLVTMFLFASFEFDPWLAAPGGAAIILTAIWAMRPVKKFKSAVKSEIYPLIFRFFGNDFVYQENGPLSAKSLERSDLIPYFEDEKREDYIKGSYNDVILEMTESKLTKETGSGKNRQTVTVFKGLFILLSMNKNFSGKTLVKKDFGRLGNWFSQKFGDKENVKLEDPEFEDKFEVFSTDQIEARYLLTPSVMERLLTLANIFRSGALQCSFYDDKLLLMIPSDQDRFETGSIFKPATFVDEINTILQELPMVFRIIDVLKLDQRTGL